MEREQEVQRWLAGDEDDATIIDREFFNQHSNRRFRARPALAHEIASICQHYNFNPILPPGFCWWMIVHCVRLKPEAHLRLPTIGPCLQTEPSESMVRKAWEDQATPEAKQYAKSFSH
jgi:hypothetical protein